MLSPVPACTAQPLGGSVGHPLYLLQHRWLGGSGGCARSEHLSFGNVSASPALERSCSCCLHSLNCTSLVLQVVWLHGLGWGVGFLGHDAGNTSQAVWWSDSATGSPNRNLVPPLAPPEDGWMLLSQPGLRHSRENKHVIHTRGTNTGYWFYNPGFPCIVFIFSRSKLYNR